jgi:hypothetical protein
MIHTYYTFSLAAPIALVVPVGLAVLWRKRDERVLCLVGCVIVGSTTYMCLRILDYSDEWPIWFRVAVVTAGLVAMTGWLLARSVVTSIAAVGAVALAIALGPIGADIYTLGTPQNGTNPQSGPIANNPMAMSRLLSIAKEGRPAWALQTAFGSKPSATVIEMLRQTTAEQGWAAATYSAQNAALYQLESRRAVIALGGWLGTDPAPTLAEFKDLVHERRIGYFIWQQDLLDRNELSAETLQITDWVQNNFKEQTVDNVKIYDLR